MNWQPISTAPRGKPVIVAGSLGMNYPCVAEDDPLDGWVIETPFGWCSIDTPTHWMPLPPPPKD